MAEVIFPEVRIEVSSIRQPFLLSEVSGSFLLAWNEALGYWTLSVFNNLGEKLFGPLTVTNQTDDLWCSFHHLDIPPGRLICRSVDSFPGRDAFARSARLVYITDDDA